MIVIPAALAFMAIEPTTGYRLSWTGEILIGKSYPLKMNREDALARIKATGFTVESDSATRMAPGVTCYRLKNVVLDGSKDTIEVIHFSLREEGSKTLLEVSRLKLKNGKDNIQHLQRLSRYYRRLIRSNFVEEVR